MSATKSGFVVGGPKKSAVTCVMTTVGPAARKLQKKMAADTSTAMYHLYRPDQFSGSSHRVSFHQLLNILKEVMLQELLAYHWDHSSGLESR